jgi:hypothetical protein
MAINLNVTIKTSGTDAGYLDVDQSGNANHVPQNPNAQTITWKLNGNANGGTFNAMNAANPGFAWIGTSPPAGIFGTPVPDNQGNMTMSDNNIDSSTAGTWTYKLWATINGSQYSTTSTLSTRATTTDPTIKNN